jgi:hypothetical protein
LPKPKPQYSAAEITANSFTVGLAMMRGGRLTDRAKRGIARRRDSAQLRGELAAEK